MPEGLFRDGDYAQVGYDDKARCPVPRTRYELQGYHPPFDQLPTREEYEIHQGWQQH